MNNIYLKPLIPIKYSSSERKKIREKENKILKKTSLNDYEYQRLTKNEKQKIKIKIKQLFNK